MVLAPTFKYIISSFIYKLEINLNVNFPSAEISMSFKKYFLSHGISVGPC